MTGSVTPSGGTLLLGQSFLGRFKAWSIDNAQHKLVLEPQAPGKPGTAKVGYFVRNLPCLKAPALRLYR